MANDSTTDINKALLSSYLENKYDQTIDLLLKNKSHFDIGLFHYNLGTLYAKNNEWAPARFHLEKSIKLGHVTTGALHNLGLVKEKLHFTDLGNSPQFMNRTLDALSLMPDQFFYSLSLVLGILLMILAKWLKKNSLKMILLVIVISAIPMGLSFYLNKNLHCVIALGEIQVYSGPSEIYTTSSTLSSGSKILIRPGQSGWSYILMPIDLNGWVKNDNLGFY